MRDADDGESSVESGVDSESDEQDDSFVDDFLREDENDNGELEQEHHDEDRKK